MKRIIVFDTEDNSPELLKKGRSGFDKKVTQIAALSSDDAVFYSDRSDNVTKFLGWIKRQPSSLIYAHNLQYDLGNLFADRLDEVDVTLVGSRMISATWKGIEFRDSLNMWLCSVKVLGDAFGLKKGKLDTKSKAYVFRDVEIVMKAMKFIQKMCETYNIKKLPCTIGGLAVRIWKSLGGENWHCDSLYAREGLYGGRVELFARERTGKLIYTDVNSLYPSCMRMLFPTKCESMKDVDGFGVAGVKIFIPPDDTFIAPLPVRQADYSIAYPTGVLEGVWTHHEIRNAVTHGAKLQHIYDSVGSSDGKEYYADFVEYCYALRQKTTNEATRLFYKLLMNNLYGQLAVKGSITKSQEVTKDYSGEMFGDKALITSITSLPRHVNYLHGSYVTSYGRLVLQDYLRMIPEKDLIYCDTDSMIFNRNGRLNFPTGAKIGQMKIVKQGKYCHAIAPKTYSFDDDYVAKGVPKTKAKDFIKNKVVTYQQPYKYREAVKFYDRGNIKKLSVWREVQKELLTEYDKKKFVEGSYYPKDISEIEVAEQEELAF